MCILINYGGDRVFYSILFLLINILNCHDCNKEKCFYDQILPEIFADSTHEEKQEIYLKLKEMQQLQNEIDELIKTKRNIQEEDLLNYLLSQKKPLQENQQ